MCAAASDIGGVPPVTYNSSALKMPRMVGLGSTLFPSLNGIIGVRQVRASDLCRREGRSSFMCLVDLGSRYSRLVGLSTLFRCFRVTLNVR